MKKDDIKWLIIILIFKVSMFLYFNYEFHNHWPKEKVHGLWIEGNDTADYYEPIENLAKGHGYSCAGIDESGTAKYYPIAYRMPGLLPLYLPLYFLFGAWTGRNLIVFFQLLMGIASVYLSGRITEYLFNNRRAFIITIVLCLISNFVSIYEHFGLSDSIHISTMIFSLYCFMRFLHTNSTKWIFLSGFFLTWSVFMRPIVGPFFLLLPIIYICLLFKHKRFKVFLFIKHMLLFTSLFVFCIAAWAYRNYIVFNQFIPLQLPLEQATTAYPKERQAIFKFIIAQGEDFVYFYKGTLGEWFSGKESDSSFDLSKLIYTSRFNEEDIIDLRRLYGLTKSKTLAEVERKRLKHMIIDLTHKYTESIRLERPLQYYLISRIKLLCRFLFPKRYAVPLPFPALKNMKAIHVIIKGFSYVLFYLINISGFVGIGLAYAKRNLVAMLFSILPLSLIFILFCLLGYIEQRYYVPVFILIIFYAGYAIQLALEMFDNKFSAGHKKAENSLKTVALLSIV